MYTMKYICRCEGKILGYDQKPLEIIETCDLKWFSFDSTAARIYWKWQIKNCTSECQSDNKYFEINVLGPTVIFKCSLDITTLVCQICYELSVMHKNMKINWK